MEIRYMANRTQRIAQDLRVVNSVTEAKEWLHPSDPSTNYDKAMQKQQEGSGQRFLECP